MTKVQYDLTINGGVDTSIVNTFPNTNMGANPDLYVGKISQLSAQRPGAGIYRGLIRFTIPNFNGTIVRQQLKLRKTVAYGATPNLIEVYMMKNPVADYWEEGTQNPFGSDQAGATWNGYLSDRPWDNPGSDFETEPILIWVLPVGAPLTMTKDILLENYTFERGKTCSVVLIGHEVLLAPQTERAVGIDAKETPTTQVPQIILTIEYEVPDGVGLVASTVSSSELKLNWEKTNIAGAEFDYYEIEQSNNGSVWNPLTTISDIDTLEYRHTGVVIPANVHAYNHALDTYPNGRKIYYRVRTVGTDGTQTGAWSQADATTIPAVRSFSIIVTKKSPSAGVAYPADGDDVYGDYFCGWSLKINWSSVATLDEYLDYLYSAQYIKDYVVWIGAGTLNTDIESADEEIILSANYDYQWHKLNFAIFDTGGLGRNATLDLVTLQNHYGFPNPVPSGAPLEDSGSYESEEIISIDLSHAGQQEGEKIYTENFQGTFGDKWAEKGTRHGSSSPPGWGGGNTCIEVPISALSTTYGLWKRVLEENPALSGNPSKTTGNYTMTWVFKLPATWPVGGATYYWHMYWGFHIFAAAHSPTTPWTEKGIHFNMNNLNNAIGIRIIRDSTTWQYEAMPGFDIRAHMGQYYAFRAIYCPRRDSQIPRIFYAIHWGNTLNDALNFNYNTDWAEVVSFGDTYTSGVGRRHNIGSSYFAMQVNTAGIPGTDRWQVWTFDQEGKVPNSLNTFEGQGYGTYVQENNELFGLQSTNVVPAKGRCLANQPSSTIKAYGRVSNEYGARAHTDFWYANPTVTNKAPIARLLTPPQAFVDAPMTANGSLSYDPEGGTLTYEFDFNGTIVTQSTPIATHIFTTPGTKTIKLRVKDQANNWSTQETNTVELVTQGQVFTPVTFLSPEPFTAVAPKRSEGDDEAPIPGRATTYYQHGETGGRQFSLSGYTTQKANLPYQTLIDNAKAEIDKLDGYFKNGTLLALDIPTYGTVYGYIGSFEPEIDEINPRLWTWSMVFKEIDIEQLEDV